MLHTLEILLLCVLIVSFLTGCFIKGTFNLYQYKWAMFATPIGFFAYMAVLQLGYMIITYYNVITHTENQTWLLQYTKYVTISLVVLSLFFFKFILIQLKRYISIDGVIKLILSLLIFSTLVSIFKYTKINYRLDDINFYAPFIYDRLYFTNNNLGTYIYQGYYIYIAVLWEWLNEFIQMTGFDTVQRLPFVLWMPSLLCLWVLSFSITDLQGYAREKFSQNRYLGWLVWSVVIVFTMLDYWYFQNPNTGNSIRRLPLFFSIILIEEIIRNDRILLMFPASILIGSAISFSSSAFFISMILLYSYAIYAMIQKNRNWLWGLSIMLIYPFLMGAFYKPEFSKIFIFFYLVILGSAFIFSILKMYSFPSKLKWLGIMILVFVPLGIVILNVMGIPNQDTVQMMLENRTFFDRFGTWDQVPEILQFPHSMSEILVSFQNLFTFKINSDFSASKLVTMNLFFWIMLFISIVVSFKRKSWPLFLVLATIVTFYNPLVMNFVGAFLTGLGYYRISDLIMNPIVATNVIYVLVTFFQSQIYRYIICGLLSILFAVLSIFKFQFLNLKTYIDDEMMRKEYSYEYHTEQEDLDVINRFIDLYYQLPEEERDENHDGELKVVMHVYGGQLFTDKLKIKNTLEDRFAFQVIDNSEYERIFSRKYPGVEGEFSNLDYTHACSLAFANNTDYVVFDAQYNMDLQAGLWPCTKMLDDKGRYRFIKIDKTYWNLMLKEKQTKKFKVENKNVIGEEEYIEKKDKKQNVKKDV